MEHPSDGELLAVWRTGDTEAFGQLVDRHQAPLLRHARSLLGERGGCEDAVQDAFLKLAQQPPVLDPTADPAGQRAQLASWLHRVTRNLCMDALRSETRRRKREETVAATEATSGGLRRVEEDDTREAVEKSLSKLPDDQREVLALRLFGDRSYREIAEITGKKIGTVGWLISVGLKSLASELSPLLQPRTAAHGAPTQGGARLQGEV